MEKKKFVKPSMKTVPLKTESLLAGSPTSFTGTTEPMVPGGDVTNAFGAPKATKIGGSKSSKYQY